MQKVTLLTSFILLLVTLNAQVAINSNGASPNSSAMLDISSTNKGMLVPRLTFAQRELVTTPATGLLIFQTDSVPGFYFNAGTSDIPNWDSLPSAVSKIMSENGFTSVDVTYGEIDFKVSETSQMYLTSTGQLEIYANMKITSTSPGYGKVLTSDAYGNASWQTPSGGGGIPDEITDSDGDTRVQVEAGADEDYIRFDVAGSEVVTIDNSGNVGIGTSMPGQQLEITGAMSLPATTSSTTGVIYKGSNRFIHDYTESGTDGVNTFMGYNSGNFTMAGSSSEASYNAGFGGGTLNSLSSGAYNTASGAYSLYKNSTANNNVALGTATLYNTTTGGNNTALGMKSGYLNQTGVGNVFLGYQAGYNETGSDKLYIDNSNTATPLIHGDFSTDVVTINGDIKVTGGTPGTGKVLTSDADGLGSWQTSSGVTEIDDLSDAKTDPTSVFLGAGAGDNDDGNNENTALGLFALTDNTSGHKNTAIGISALYSNQANDASTAVGYQSMYYADNTTTGRTTYNTAIGYQALMGSNIAINNTGRYNTALGSYALLVNTSGDNNTAIGVYSLCSNTTGNENTAFGSNSLYYNTIGFDNTAFGNGALTSNIANSGSTAIGKSAMNYADNRSTGRETHNTAVGYQALMGSTTAVDNSGRYNTAVGSDALTNNTSGSNNTANGYLSLNSNTTGEKNTALGISSLQYNTIGTNNTAIGNWALSKNVANSGSTAVGVGAMNFADDRAIGTQTYNTAVGFWALRGSSTPADNTGRFNTAIGSSSLDQNTSGDDNTTVGFEAGNTITEGNNNTFLGSGADATGSYLSNSMALGYYAEVNSSNKVVIGNSDVTTIGGYASWSNYSDRRLKENIIYTNELGLDFISQLKTASYNYKTDENKNRRDGLIAQDVQRVMEDLGVEFSGLIIDQDSMQTLNLSYVEFVIPLINAVKEQQALIDGLLKEKKNTQEQIAIIFDKIENLERK